MSDAGVAEPCVPLSALRLSEAMGRAFMAWHLFNEPKLEGAWDRAVAILAAELGLGAPSGPVEPVVVADRPEAPPTPDGPGRAPGDAPTAEGGRPVSEDDSLTLEGALRGDSSLPPIGPEPPGSPWAALTQLERYRYFRDLRMDFDRIEAEFQAAIAQAKSLGDASREGLRGQQLRMDRVRDDYDAAFAALPAARGAGFAVATLTGDPADFGKRGAKLSGEEPLLPIDNPIKPDWIETC